MEKSGRGVTSPPDEPELLEDELELLEDELELLEDELELELLEDELELELEDEELLEDDELLEAPVASSPPPQPASATDANASTNQRENRCCCEFVMDVSRNCLPTIVIMGCFTDPSLLRLTARMAGTFSGAR
ncbi:hypothetical protein WME76_25490 [Sorangium sp. So ce119]|uniref:hypothetical protein n=1 Tax=Sorangium sp. So ce119 TaxID=3133279 RepID=UPI003F60E957